MTHTKSELTQGVLGNTDLEWNTKLESLINVHFELAHQRVDGFYNKYFASFKSILGRHWQHRRDIPRDLITIPRTTWRFAKRLAGRKGTASKIKLSGKELAVTKLIIDELLQLRRLEQDIFQFVLGQSEINLQQLQELQEILGDYTPDNAQQKIDLALRRLTVTQEGGRDVLVFLTLGLIGRPFADKVVFGSALGIGSTAATGIYISQQSFIGAIWTKWMGVPLWVSISGALVGISALLLATPMIAPVVEFGVNRFRAKPLLHGVIDQVRHNLLNAKTDTTSIAGLIGSYIQLMPDLLQILRAIR